MKRCLVLVSAALLMTTLISGGASGREFLVSRSGDGTNCDEYVRVLDDFMEDGEGGIPTDVLRDCVGIGIFANVVQAAAGGGVGGGPGVILRMDDDGIWSPPAFYRWRTLSTGVQLGVQEMDIIIFAMSEDAMRDLLDADVTLGGSVAVTNGPNNEAYDVNDPLDEDSILTYVRRSRGAYAGISVSGSRITPDDTTNEDLYGDDATTEFILYDPDLEYPEETLDLLDALDYYFLEYEGPSESASSDEETSAEEESSGGGSESSSGSSSSGRGGFFRR